MEDNKNNINELNFSISEEEKLYWQKKEGNEDIITSDDFEGLENE